MSGGNKPEANHVREINCRKCSTGYRIGVAEEPVHVLKAIIQIPECEWRYVRTDSFVCKCGNTVQPKIPIWIDKTDRSPDLRIVWREEMEGKK